VIDGATDQVPVQDAEEGTARAKSDNEYCNVIAAASVSSKSRQIDLLMPISRNDEKAQYLPERIYQRIPL
jgi:hypothetical protein